MLVCYLVTIFKRNVCNISLLGMEVNHIVVLEFKLLKSEVATTVNIFILTTKGVICDIKCLFLPEFLENNVQCKMIPSKHGRKCEVIISIKL